MRHKCKDYAPLIVKGKDPQCWNEYKSWTIIEDEPNHIIEDIVYCPYCGVKL